MARSVSLEWAILACLFLVEWTLAILLVAVIKNLVSNPEMQYPYPIMSTFIMNIGTGFLALLVAQLRRAHFYVASARSVSLSHVSLHKSWWRGFFNIKPRITMHEYVRGLLPIGVIMGLEVGLSNTALKILPVSLKTMIQACNPAIVVVCAWAMGLQNITWQILVVLACVVGGGLLSAHSGFEAGHVQGLALGLILCTMSLTLQGCRFCFTQRVLTKGPGLGLKDDDRDDVVKQITKLQNLATEHLLSTHAPLSSRSKTVPVGASPHDAEEGHPGLSRARSTHHLSNEVQVFVKSRCGSKAAHVSKIEVMALTNPVLALVCLGLAAIYEPDAFKTPAVGWFKILTSAFGCSVFVLAKMGLDFLLIQRTSAFIFSLAGVVHNLLIIISGVVLFGDYNPPIAWVGFAFISAGVSFYAWQKAKDASRGGH